jgi:hypothetical protein
MNMYLLTYICIFTYVCGHIYTYICIYIDMTLHIVMQQEGVDTLIMGSYADLEWYSYIHIHVCIFVYVFI